MSTTIFSHQDCRRHHPTPGHPEQPARYAAVEQALQSPQFDHLDWVSAPLATYAQAQTAHHAGYLDKVAQEDKARKANHVVALDPDTSIGAYSMTATFRALGAGIAAVDAVVTDQVDNAFCLVRPPGHHAEPDKAMGFCIFNSVVIAAHHARHQHGLNRIAVVDFDVHHGNGTQAMLWDDPDAFFASSHEWPQYPGSGLETERGAFDQIHNARLDHGTCGYEFQKIWADRLLPALSDFEPDIIMVSAGFDGHEADPLGGHCLREEDYAWIGTELSAIARDKCQGRVVSMLEGGYDLDALGKSAAHYVNALAIGD